MAALGTKAARRKIWFNYWFGDVTDEYLEYKKEIGKLELNRARSVQRSPSGVGGNSWSHIGPLSEDLDPNKIDSGRLNEVVLHPNWPATPTIYVASAGGGVWKATNATLPVSGIWNWASITDDLPTASATGNIPIGSMAINSTGKLYIGLGDPFATDAKGFYTSVDDGANWVEANVIGTYPKNTLSIFVYEDIPGKIFWGTSIGLFVSVDDGANFTLDPTLSSQSIWSIVKLGTTILVTRRGFPGTIHYSTDGGTTWNPSTVTPKVGTALGRITIAASAVSTTTAWAMYEDTNTTDSVTKGLLKTTDGGVNWSFVQPLDLVLFEGVGQNVATDDGTQGWYNHMLAVDPDNVDTIFIGTNLAVYRSINGGLNWTQISVWTGSPLPYLHADMHCAQFYSNGPTKYLFLGHDGGLSVVLDPYRVTIPGGYDGTFINTSINNGLGTFLLYSVGSSITTTPAGTINKVSVGCQDNGTRIREGATSVFNERNGGDGVGTLIHRTDGNLILASYQDGGLRKSIDGGLNFGDILTGLTDPNNFPFHTRYYYGNGDDIVYTYSKNIIYKSTDFGDNWAAVPSSTFVDTIRIMGASTTTSALGVYHDNGVGKVNYSGTWNTVGALPNVGFSGSISSIWFNTMNDTIIYVTSTNPSEIRSHIWKSVDSGVSWAAIDVTNGLPFGVPIHCVENLPGLATTIFAGLDYGVYVSEDDGGTWNRFGNNMPLVAVYAMYLSPTPLVPSVTRAVDGTAFMRVATYGRGVWEIPLEPFLDPPVDPIPVICFYHKSIINGKRLDEFRIGEKYKLTQKEKFVTLKNIHILPQNQVNTFIKIPPNAIRYNVPNSEIIVTEEHEFRVNGLCIQAKDLVGKYPEITTFQEFVEYNFMLEMEEFGTTKEHHYVEINGMEVGVWGCDHYIAEYFEHVKRTNCENMYRSHKRLEIECCA